MSDVDFEQAQNIEFHPEYKISLIHFKLEQEDFIDVNTNQETPLHLDYTNIDLFRNSSNLERVILKFEIDNTSNKEFTIDFILIDSEDLLLQTIPFTIEENNISTLNIEYLKGSIEFDNLIKTTKITVTINLLPNNNNITSDMYLHFKSAINLFFKISNE